MYAKRLRVVDLGPSDQERLLREGLGTLSPDVSPVLHRGMCGCSREKLRGKNMFRKNRSRLFVLFPNLVIQVNHATYSTCSSCGMISKANSLSSTVSRTVQCECGTSYCFGCNRPPHVPASCRDVSFCFFPFYFAVIFIFLISCNSGTA